MSEKLRILAVDDNIVILASIEQALKNEYEVITVNSGTRALRYIKSEKPDLILLDVQMALKDGLETLTEIREMDNGASIPVIMLTAKNDRDTIVESSKLGAVDYLLKPIDPQVLKERIHQTLKRVGVIPIEDSELYEHVKGVQKCLWVKDTRRAILKLDAILNFKLDEEIFGRLQSAKSKLVDEDEDTARRLVGRVLKMLQKKIAPGEASVPFDARKMRRDLRELLDDLKEFEVHEASQKLEEIMRYDSPPEITEICEMAQESLKEYDDGAAEKLIKEALVAVEKYMN